MKLIDLLRFVFNLSVVMVGIHITTWLHGTGPTDEFDYMHGLIVAACITTIKAVREVQG